MTKDNLGSEHWQSDQARIVKLEAQVARLTDNEGAFMQACERLQARIRQAVDVIEEYGMTDGEHHKQWVLDQVMRALLADSYNLWIEVYNNGEWVKWDTGIAP